MLDDSQPPQPARVEWVGDSREVLKSFPKAIQYELGGELWSENRRRRKMANIDTEIRHVTTGDVFTDLGFTPEEAAVARLKTKLHVEIMKVIKDRSLTPKQLEAALGVPQPRVSELVNGKIYGMTVDKLTQYLHRLGQSVDLVTHNLDSEAQHAVEAG